MAVHGDIDVRWYRVIRTRAGEATMPSRVLEFVTVHDWQVARAVREIWERTPAVKAGKESVTVVEYLISTLKPR